MQGKYAKASVVHQTSEQGAGCQVIPFGIFQLLNTCSLLGRATESLGRK